MKAMRRQSTGTGCPERLWGSLSIEILKTHRDTHLCALLWRTAEVGGGQDDLQRSLPSPKITRVFYVQFSLGHEPS